MTVSLKDKIKQLIALNGPISVSQYMAMALADPHQGYYKTAKPFGREGDFTTAPEVSQMFGEIIGIWAVTCWQAMNRPDKFLLCEMGPGRGTLMGDMLRTIKKLSPQAFHAAKVNMVETSPQLIAQQKKYLHNYEQNIVWVNNFEQVPDGPLILVANELLDALPIQQYIKLGNVWRERVIALDQGGNLIFTLGDHTLEPSNLPKLGHCKDGTIVELSPLRLQLVDSICQRIESWQGAALLIDYGETEFGFGDTLQAMSHHQYSHIFEAPGQHDLTSHVDFASLKAIAEKNNCLTATLKQGEFLLRMGLLERAGQLGAHLDADARKKIRLDVERLAGPEEMGNLFKVLTISHQKTGLLPLFTQPNES